MALSGLVWPQSGLVWPLSAYKSHVFSHAKLALYECGICAKSFVDYKALTVRRHLKRAHKIEDTTPQALKKHYRSLVEEKKPDLVKEMKKCFPDAGE